MLESDQNKYQRLRFGLETIHAVSASARRSETSTISRYAATPVLRGPPFSVDPSNFVLANELIPFYHIS